MPEILRTPVTGPSAWTRESLGGDGSWIHTLSDAESEELLAATGAAREGGLVPAGFTAERFALPRFSRSLAEFRNEFQHGRGFVLIRGIPVDRLDRRSLLLLYSGIGAHLGRIITQNNRGDRIGVVSDQGADYAAPGVRGHASRAAIRPHCDSADLVGLLCVRPAARGGESIIASAMTIYNRILARHPEYLEVLCRGFRINLAGKGPTGRADELSRRRIPVFSYYQGRLSCRYNRKQIEDAAAILGQPLSNLERDAVDCVGELALHPGIRLRMRFEAGDLQLLNNHCILHAREAYEDDADGGRRRLLLRMWINVANGRPLAPDFADRLNTGPRGEVAITRPDAPCPRPGR